MKYASEYYDGLNTFSHAQSNMNRLCKDIEKWSDAQRYSGSRGDFDYTIMIDDSIPVNEEQQKLINSIYVEFCREMNELYHDQTRIRKNGDESLSTYDAQNFTINWGYYYEKYRERCQAICSDTRALANMAVRACYEYYPKKNNTKFIWHIAGDGVVKNIKQVPFQLPQRDINGEYDYLGKKYSFVDYDGSDEILSMNELM